MACVVTRDDLPVLGYSTMGGDGQAMFHTQGLTNVLDYGMEIQEAIERPRFVYGPIDPGDVLRHRPHRGPRARRGARGPHAARATRCMPVSDWFARTGHAHGITLHDGTLRGGADPRGDGAAIGF